MAKDVDDKGTPEAPLMLPEEALRQLPAYVLGDEHGFYAKKGRRFSVSGSDIVKWNVDDFRAYQLGLKDGAR